MKNSPAFSRSVSLCLSFLLAALLAPRTGGAQAPAADAGSSKDSAKPQEAALASETGDSKPLQPEKLPWVVAKVNGEEIKKDDLVRTVKQVQATLPAGRVADVALYHQALDQLIDRTLMELEAKAQGFTASDDEVKAQIKELRARFGSEDAFQKELAREGLTEAELTRRTGKALITQRFVEAKVIADLKVTDQEAKDFYDKNQDKMKHPERVHLRHILLKVDPSATTEDKKKARDKANALLARLKTGEDFAKLALENSDDPGSKERGGDLSWVARGNTVPPFELAAFVLKQPNELSPVTESPFGYHIIQLIERQDAGVASFDEVKEAITAFLKKKQSQERVQKRIQSLRSAGKIEIFF